MYASKILMILLCIIIGGDATENNDTTTQVAPIRIKSKGYHSSHNDVNEHPYGPLPKFAEKEMDKLRLNHWVNQYRIYVVIISYH